MRWSRRRDTLWFCFVYLSISPTKLHTKPKKGTFCRLWWRVCQQHQVLKSETGRERKKSVLTPSKEVRVINDQKHWAEKRWHTYFADALLFNQGKKKFPIVLSPYEWTRFLQLTTEIAYFTLYCLKRDFLRQHQQKPSRHEALDMIRCTYKDWYFFHFNFTKDSYDSARLEVN